jgi:uncharacterized protein
MQLLVSDIRAAHCLEESAELEPRFLLGESRDQVKFNRPVKVDVEAQMTENDIVVTGTVTTQASYTCARCLTDFEAPIKGNFQEAFPLDLEKIDLTELIRESVWVDVPLRGLCKEGCRGLCPTCGVNMNTTPCSCEKKGADSRWAALQRFRFK